MERESVVRLLQDFHSFYGGYYSSDEKAEEFPMQSR